jgi:non-ribosomal peptide synthetase component F
MSRPRPAVQSSVGRLIPLAIPKVLTASLKELSNREGVTLFMTLTAAFKALLHCYTESLDIVVGSNVANRSHQKTEDLIGFFINQLVLRTDLSGNPTFRELLVRVRDVALGAYANQDVPFEKVVDALKPERSLARQPLFQFKIDLQNAPVSSLHLPGFTLSPLDIVITVTHTDVTLSMLDSGDVITGFIQYSTDLFDHSAIKRVLDHYQMVLNRVVTEPAAQLSTLKEMIAAADVHHRTTKEEEYKDFRQRKLKNIKRRVLSGSTTSSQDGTL